MQAEQIIRAMQKGLLQWYDFKRGGMVLYMGDEKDALAEMLSDSRMHLRVLRADTEQVYDAAWQQEYHENFDYIIAIETLERQTKPKFFLSVLKKLLAKGGKLLLGTNNRFGLRYFCGDRDKYTGRNFDGIEGYCRAYRKKEDVFQGRCYSMAELKGMLREAGWDKYRFFSVLSDLQNPSLLYAEEYLPNEDLANRVFPTYYYPETVFLEEEGLYDSLAENGMFHQMSNAYLIECAPEGNFSDVMHVTSSLARSREDAMLTVMHRSGFVEKKAACPEGKKRLEKLMVHGRDLREHGIKVVDARLDDGVYVMPYIEAEVGQLYLKRLLKSDREDFLRQMDHFRDLILQSSEIVRPDRGDGQGAILRRGYLDMVPLNSFYMDGTFVFYDQEFCEENYPANAIITRMITTFYAGNVELQNLLPPQTLYERYHLTADLMHWREMEWAFLEKLRNEKELLAYYKNCRRNGEIIHSNRQRMNYADNDYQRLFIDIFKNADTRKLILFGSGLFAQRFLALYRQDYPVYAVVDNNSERWGQEVEGITIQSPEILRQLHPGEYKVLICIKNYLSVMKQLDEMGVAEYSVFDSNKDYPRKRRPIVRQPETGKEQASKKYHVGYIAGVFDLFHVGHLNMFKRAKEQCDYLIVGVVSDEGVRKFKEVDPFIPFEERIEMVRSCRYVDEAVEIPLNFGGTRDAFRMHHFDCQFSGSDYVSDPRWLEEKEFLEKHGAEMVFFPYTESTSSTRIKSLIDKKLL